MKQLLALLTTLLLCMFNNVEYTETDFREYTADNYYKVDQGEAPDYRDVYNYSPTASGKDNCKTTNYTAKGKLVTYPSGTDSSVEQGYWLVNNEAMTVGNSALNTKKYTFTVSDYIIAPYDCVLESYSATNSGHDMVVSMKVGSKAYRLTFAQMERWYCCMKKTPDEGGSILKYPWVHNSSEQYGKSFKAGDVLGKSYPNKTTVVVEELKTRGATDCKFVTMYKQS